MSKSLNVLLPLSKDTVGQHSHVPVGAAWEHLHGDTLKEVAKVCIAKIAVVVRFIFVLLLLFSLDVTLQRQ